jgi:hypothetical protein
MTLSTPLASDPRKRAQAFGHYHAGLRKNLAAGAPAAFDFPTQLVGATPDGKVTVYYDPSLGQPGAQLAQQVLTTVAKTYADCQMFFNTPGEPINVIIAAVNNVTDGSGGAYHNSCWDCGASNGEALSRFLAQQTSGGPDGALAEYATGPQWDAVGRPNWIDATAPTDQDAVSTGCGVVYLYWMLGRGFTPNQITQAGCPDGTLRSNYAALTGKTSAWTDFEAALAGLSGAIVSDDPWLRPAAVAAANPAQSRDQILIDPSSKTVALPRDWKVLSAAS